MALDSQSTVRRRELGDAVRVAMECAGLSGTRIADLLGWSESKVSRILTGHLPPSEAEVSALLALCGVVGVQRDYLLALCKEQALLGWQRGKVSVSAHQMRALRIFEFHNSLVPALLRTERYMRCISTRMVNLSQDESASWLDWQVEAQKSFKQSSPPVCTFFVHEQALRLPIGGREVMSNQLCHLLHLSARRYIDIRVVPTAAGAHPGICGSFCLMEFSEFRPVVYIESEAGIHFFEDDEDVKKYQKVVAGLSAVCGDDIASIEIINRAIVEFDKPLARLDAS